jgi:hypothetical protein
VHLDAIAVTVLATGGVWAYVNPRVVPAPPEFEVPEPAVTRSATDALFAGGGTGGSVPESRLSQGAIRAGANHRSGRIIKSAESKHAYHPSARVR